MNFDSYWRNLVERVHRKHERLEGSEDEFWRLSCVYGETMVDGIESYFDRRFHQFDADMAALRKHGFADIASDFVEAKRVIFGDAALAEHSVHQVLSELLDAEPTQNPVLKRLDTIYARLIDRLPAVADRRTELGLKWKFYEQSA